MRHAPCRPDRAAALAVATVAVLALAACGSDDGEPKQGSRPVGGTSSSSASEASDPPSASAAGSTPEVRVLDTGAAPRRLLQLEVEDGHVETSTLRMTTTVSADVMSVPPITMPMEMPFTTTVTDVSGEQLTVESSYGAVSIPAGRGLDAASREQVLKAAGALEGVTIRTVLDRSARTVSSEVEGADGDGSQVVGRLLDDIASQSNNLSILFPEEEVGVGARWRADSTITIGGITFDMTSTFELTGLTDDGYTVGVSVRQEPRPGTVTGGEVVDGSTTVTGTSEGRDGLVGPSRGTSKGHGSVTMKVGGQRVTTTFDMTMRLTNR